MITIRAKIILHENRGRTTAIKNGYRPQFNFVSESKKSGAINLINRDYLDVGNQSEVFIHFTSADYLGSDFSIGKKFTFDEGSVAIGEGEILEILEHRFNSK